MAELVVGPGVDAGARARRAVAGPCGTGAADGGRPARCPAGGRARRRPRRADRGGCDRLLRAGRRCSHLADADVTVVDFPGTRLERAVRLGATRTVEAGDGARSDIPKPPDRQASTSSSRPAGRPVSSTRRSRWCAPAAPILQVGLPSGAQEVDVHALVMREISVLTTLAHVCGEDLGPALDLLRDHTRWARSCWTRCARSTTLPEQLERLADGAAGGQGAVRPEPGIERMITTTPTQREVGQPMRAAVFHGDHDIRVEEVTAAGPARVRARFCSAPAGAASAAPTCTSTPWARSSSRPIRTRSTGRSSRRSSGTSSPAEVLEVGSGVDHVEAGQRVSVMPLLFCGSLLLLPPRAQPPVRPRWPASGSASPGAASPSSPSSRPAT